MVRLRLRRVGARNQPSFRIVAADKRSPRDGRFLEKLGHYNPRTEPATVVVDEARLYHWLKNGAQPSDSLVRVLRLVGAWDRWERLKQGEDMETLLEEAKAAQVEVDPRTRRDDLRAVASPKKSPAKSKSAKAEEAEAEAEAPEPEAKAEDEAQEAAEGDGEEPVAEAEATTADEAEPEAEAEDEAQEAAEGDSEEPVAEAEATTAEEAEPEAEAEDEAQEAAEGDSEEPEAEAEAKTTDEDEPEAEADSKEK